MIEITHQTARQLLQVSADQPLPPAERSNLDAHLSSCDACRGYANQLADLGGDLSRLMHAKWDAYRPALNPQAIRNPSPLKLLWNNFFGQTQALGKVTLIAALVLGYVAIVNLVGVRGPVINEETPTVLPTPNGLVLGSGTSPTPSIQTLITGATLQTCKTVSYVVQENDTLESIALRHGTTKEAILAYNPEENGLAANTVFTGMEILIPLCESTPSHTAGVPGQTLTTTPFNGTIRPE